MADNVAVLTVKDGSGSARSLGALTDQAGTVYPQHALRSSGALVAYTNPLPVADGNRSPAGYAQITVATATLLSALAAIPSGAQIAAIQAEGGDIRYRDDGTAPTTTIGMRVYAGETLRYTGDLTALRLVATGTSAVVNVSFYR